MLQLEVQPALIDQVHDRLLAAIADGTLASGQRLTQESVAAMLGVSRQPVSHALQVLKRRGFLSEHGKRGLQVTPIDSRRIRDLYLVREALDGLAARLAAQRIKTGDASDAERKPARSALAAGDKLGPRSPIARLIDADVAFHSAIHALSGNQAIVQTVADQWPHFRRSMGLVLSVSGASARYWDEHAAILEAVLAGDAAAGRGACALAHRPRGRGDRAAPRGNRSIQHAKQRRMTMKLNAQQARQFEDEGWLFLPETFSPEEVAILRSEAEGIYKLDRPQIWREKSGAPRTAFAAHTYNEAFGILGRHPRLTEPVEQLFGEKLYMHQFKINAKAKFDGDVWQWHQDYGTWARDDGMPEPKAMNIAVFLDEVFTFNGPLMLIPKSHKHGVLAAGHDKATTSYPLWTLDHATVEKLVDEGGLVAPTGKPGGVLLFHGNLVHGSAGNITPFSRKIVYLTLNAVSNYIRKPTRAEWIAHRDFAPIEACADDALLRYAQSHRQAAE